VSTPSTDRSLDSEIDAARLPRVRFRGATPVLKPIARACARSGPAAVDWFVIIAVLAWPSLIVRTLLVVTTTPGFRVADARGYLSDLGVAIMLGTAALVPRSLYRRILVGLSIAMSALVSLINFEHVRANGSSFDVAAAYLLFDKTFARGSILGASVIGLSTLVIGPPVAAFFSHERWGKHSGRRVRLFELGLALGTVVLLETLLPVPSDRVHWRQQHPLIENAARQLRQTVRARSPRGSARAPLPPEYKHLREQDLSGKSIFTGRRTVRNVLLVLVEGLSRGHVFTMSGARQGPGWLAHLAEFAQRHVDYTDYLSLQRQTNRGEYSVLCGDLPNMVTRDSEMDVYSATPPSERAECLPEFLRRNGWRTVYLQAAPITFMGKDEFLPNAGFSSVLDTKWFSKAYATSGWGVDDRAFFEQAGDLILELERGGAPWFLSLLTVGTHHPYLIPPEWKGRSKTGAFEDSLLYLDAVLQRFLALLEKEHVLEHTLLLITGDESAGYMLENETAEILAQHSVPLIAAYPGDSPRRISERFSHSDLALSVADAVGLGESSAFHGRSAFRQYSEGRRLVFGNIYLSKVGAVGPRDELLLCERSLDACTGLQLGNGGMFQAAPSPREAGGEEAAHLKQAISALDREVPASSERRVLLLKPSAVRLRSKDEEQLVFYGKYHSTHHPARASVRLALDVDGGSVILHHDIASHGGTQVLSDTPRLSLLPRTNLVWNYDLAMREPIDQLEFRMSALNRASSEVVLDVKEASVEIDEQASSESSAPARDSFEVVAQQFVVTLGGETRVNILEHRGFLSRAQCVTDGARGSWSIGGCGEGTPIFGPYMPLPADVTASVSFEIDVQGGSATSYVEMVAESGRNVLGRSVPVTLAQGHRKVDVAVRLTRQHADVETRLHVSKVSNLVASVAEVWIDVGP
jgi:hypothetical protein